MDVASPKRGGQRPKAPDVELSSAGAKVSVADGAGASSLSPDVVAGGAVASSPSPEVVADEVDHSFSRDTSQDTEPVSISDLEAVFQPGHAPPLWSGSTDPATPATSITPASSEPAAPSDREVSSGASPRSSESAAASLRRMEELVGGALPAENPSSARAILAPVLLAVSRTSDAPPVSSQPLSDRELLFELDKPDTAPPPAIRKRKPSFFDIDDAPAPGSHLFDAAPAPFDPHVPALPGRRNLQDDDDENNPDSGLLDIRRLAARGRESESRKKKNAARASEDIFNLTGGLFAGGASAPLVAPDLNALIAPVVSESSRPSAPSRARTSAAPPGERISSAPVAAVQARQRTLAAPLASPLGARAGWAAAIVIVGVVLVFVFLKMASSSTTVTTAETATPVVAVETAKPALPIATTPPVASPEPTVAVHDPGAPTKREKDPVAATPVTSTPRATAAPSPAGAGAAPVVAAPVVVAPVVAPPPPPPPVAAEFSKSAAISALAAAAGRAAGCKQADGPSGGATVSITFAPSGRVTSSKVTGPPFQGTVVGGCIARAFRSASVPPFEGSPVTITKNVSVR